jgi:tRNA(adenine34) deaminase
MAAGMTILVSPGDSSDEMYMRRALELARRGADLGEVPVGAVVVLNGEVIGEGFNQPITARDPTAHAEVVALRSAAQRLGNYRLVDCVMYVTLEPCLMCCGALVHARLREVVYGADEPKAGSVRSRLQVLDLPHLNYRVAARGGVLREECSRMLSEFFRLRRAQGLP